MPVDPYIREDVVDLAAQILLREALEDDILVLVRTFRLGKGDVHMLADDLVGEGSSAEEAEKLARSAVAKFEHMHHSRLPTILEEQGGGQTLDDVVEAVLTLTNTVPDELDTTPILLDHLADAIIEATLRGLYVYRAGPDRFHPEMATLVEDAGRGAVRVVEWVDIVAATGEPMPEGDLTVERREALYDVSQDLLGDRDWTGVKDEYWLSDLVQDAVDHGIKKAREAIASLAVRRLEYYGTSSDETTYVTEVGE